MKPFTAYACAWIATSVAASIGLWITKNANCLWVFFFPACLTFKTSEGTTTKEDSNGET